MFNNQQRLRQFFNLNFTRFYSFTLTCVCYNGQVRCEDYSQILILMS